MANNCLDKDLLKYSGTGQLQRILNALLNNFVNIDERSAADLILFTKKYGAYLNYFDTTNNVAGDWQNFMANDVSVIIAGIADLNTKDFTPFIEHVNSEITSSANDIDEKKYFKPIFDLVFSLAVQLDQNLQRIPSDVSYQNFLGVTIASNLAIPLNVIFQYYQVFKAALLIDETSTYVESLMPVTPVTFSQNFQIANLSLSWQTTVTAPSITLTGIVQDDIKHIITHNLFTGPLNSFLNGISNLVNQTPAYLQETLQNYSSHAPHYALYLTFLRLFQFAQNHLNAYTQNHLDFYYKEVLNLNNRVASPDFVHLIFELQKNITDHLLSKGTSFKAGKDSNNNDLFYSLTNDIVIQTATVSALRSFYLAKTPSAILYASPVANSDDGQGAKLLSADKSWLPFGNPQKTVGATIGFAIASNVLYLNEGARTVTLLFTCDTLKGIAVSDLLNIFTIRLTGKKSWYTAGNYSVKIINNKIFMLSIIMDGAAPAIIPYSQNIHGGNFNIALPMMQVLLNDYKSYQKIKTLKIANIIINVTATVKDLSLQNDDGKINPAKPFKPFGEFPEPDASFIMGSKEIFQKNLTSLTINTDWQQPPANEVNGDALVLNEGEWSLPFTNSINLSDGSISLSGLTNITKSPVDFTANDDYQVSSVNGFIKLRYTKDEYSIGTYLSGVQNSISGTSVTLTKDGDGNVTGFTLNAPSIQEPPTPPIAKSISIDYAANAVITFAENTQVSFSERANFYFHIEPFGYREMHPFITNDALSFLPVFDLDDGVAKDNGGELWIGLNNGTPSETLSILFQISDGSANPLKNMTDVIWYYLSNNNWKQFDHLSITDQTNNLTSSALVIVNVPADATIDNTRADNGLLWIKLVVNHDTDAVCNLIDVRANSAKATFVQDLKNGIEFTNPIPASTISKPAIADAALKKTEQPYVSFDGQPHETDAQFYVRISERLRHKQRAITYWDYERLVLQYFPQIHKAKCINHTGLINDDKTNTQKYSEVLPGHVMVVTIPDLSGNPNANLLRPYTSVGLLTEIQQYLTAFTSPFVRLHVTNPQFEEVQFDFEVTFYKNYDIAFYTNQLNNEIEQFLTPWAFKAGADIEFGGTIEKSVVLNFVEERSYVDFVTFFKMNQIIKREGNIIITALYDVEEAVASTARSVLVSYYNEVTA